MSASTNENLETVEEQEGYGPYLLVILCPETGNLTFETNDLDRMSDALAVYSLTAAVCKQRLAEIAAKV